MVNIRPARLTDIVNVCKLRSAAAGDLRHRFGAGPWTRVSYLNIIRRVLERGTLYVVEIDSGATIVGSFTLDYGYMPGFYKKKWFANPGEAEFYCMRSMAIHPGFQRQGHGRDTMKVLEAILRRRGCKSLRFDAYKGNAGAGAFYGKCGYKKVHEGKYNGAELEFFEKTLS